MRDLEQRAIELACHEGRYTSVVHTEPWMSMSVAIGLAREAADARTEEIAAKIDMIVEQGGFSASPHGDGWRGGLMDAASIVRGFIVKPRTREQVLAEAP